MVWTNDLDVNRDDMSSDIRLAKKYIRICA